MSIVKDILGFLPYTGYILAFGLGAAFRHYASVVWSKTKVTWVALRDKFGSKKV